MQKKELREYRKKAKAQEAQAQLPQVEPIPLIIEVIEPSFRINGLISKQFR